ncbi:alpha/beta hydrolase [Nocardia yamanashiensis]|uniref:alpha/beta hydrolase n=1 Tax=Nocardia yamanashiensis TaxID=209247 RepID=UPI000A032CF3|nr:alpha/beta hydrolase [Nocardia yamanashiensis]
MGGRGGVVWPTVLGILLAVAGCGSSSDAADSGLAEFYDQAVQWGPCDGFHAQGKELSAAGLQCAGITVPLDYEHPGRNTVRIGLSRLAARGDRLDAILLQPGGPGESGLAMPLGYSESVLGERFDLIGIDVRGLGSAQPKVECLTPDEALAARSADSADYSQAGIERTEQRNREYVAKCVERSGVKLLSHVGTREVARDLDVVRAVLRTEKLNMLGVSYGSRVGSTYAELFPDRVRAMVLDAAVNPESSITDAEVFSVGFQRAFEAYAAECAKTAECPLGSDPARATSTLHALIDPLIDRPAATTDPRGLGYMDALSAVLNSLYFPGWWPGLTEGLTELRQGRGDALLGRADFFATDIVDHNLQQAVFCLDEKRITTRAAAGEAVRRSLAVAPMLDDGRFTGTAPLDVCAFWPIAPTSQPHVPNVPGLPMVVVVATTGDPATPYEGGVVLARDLHAALITREGNGHGGFNRGSACVDNAVLRYFVDLTPPAEGIRCTTP